MLKCPECKSTKLTKAGKVTSWRKRKPIKHQRWLCKNCGLHTTIPKEVQ